MCKHFWHAVSVRCLHVDVQYTMQVTCKRLQLRGHDRCFVFDKTSDERIQNQLPFLQSMLHSSRQRIVFVDLCLQQSVVSRCWQVAVSTLISIYLALNMYSLATSSPMQRCHSMHCLLESGLHSEEWHNRLLHEGMHIKWSLLGVYISGHKFNCAVQSPVWHTQVDCS